MHLEDNIDPTWGKGNQYWKDRAESDKEFLETIEPIFKPALERELKRLVSLGILEEIKAQ